MKRRFTPHEESEILKQYEAGKTAKELSKAYHCPVPYIYHIVSITRRSEGYNPNTEKNIIPSQSEEIQAVTTTRYERMTKIINDQRQVIADLAIENWKLKQQSQNNPPTNF